jgi:hypothetical protein
MYSKQQTPRSTFRLEHSAAVQGTPCCYAIRTPLQCARDATTTVRCCRRTSCRWASRKTVAPSSSEAGRHSSWAAGFWRRRSSTTIFRNFGIRQLLQKLSVASQRRRCEELQAGVLWSRHFVRKIRTCAYSQSRRSECCCVYMRFVSSARRQLSYLHNVRVTECSWILHRVSYLFLYISVMNRIKNVYSVTEVNAISSPQ